MRRLGLTLLSTSALAALVATPADAASPVYSWTGFYFGGNVGYSWGKAKADGNTPGITADTGCCGVVNFPGAHISDKMNLDGWIGGGQIGYNWQTAPNWLWGVEADIQASGEKGTGKASSHIDTFFAEGEGCCDAFGDSNARYEAKIKWFGTLRARTGFITSNNLLFYATGGLAYGKVSFDGKTSTSVDFFDGGTSGTFLETASGGSSFSASKVKYGYTAGFGVEGPLWDPRWTWKAEYLFMDLGTLNVSNDMHVKFTDNIARFGFNFRP